MSLRNVLLKGTIFETKVPVEGVVARFGMTMDKDKEFSLLLTLEGNPAEVYRMRLVGAAEDAVLTMPGDRVRFTWQPASQAVKGFENVTRKGEATVR